MGKKALTLILAFLLGMALLSGGWASWRDKVEIRGTVHTGSWSESAAEESPVEPEEAAASAQGSAEAAAGQAGQDNTAPTGDNAAP
ncbi:MAG: hypothetical protein ACPL5F_08940 [Moorellaceae bacterium]